MAFDQKSNQLIKQLLHGDRHAVTSFIDSYGQFIYHVCYKILLSKPEAEEASQDTIMKVINAISNFDQNASFKAWCYTIAYRTALDYNRKRKYHLDLNESVALVHENRADDQIQEKETKRSISELLNHLDEDSRSIVSLYYLEEKSIKEVVDITGMTESNIKIKLFRSRKEMAKHVNRYFELTR